MPRLNDEIEIWFFNTYRQMKILTGFEHHISITDFKHYFEIYPLAFDIFLVISLIKDIESKIKQYQKKLDDLKKEANKNKK